MTGRVCFKEGCDARAPYGFRLPGPMGELPDGLRWKYLWSCREHMDEAEARRDRKAEEVML